MGMLGKSSDQGQISEEESWRSRESPSAFDYMIVSYFVNRRVVRTRDTGVMHAFQRASYFLCSMFSALHSVGARTLFAHRSVASCHLGG